LSADIGLHDGTNAGVVEMSEAVDSTAMCDCPRAPCGNSTWTAGEETFTTFGRTS